MTVSVSSIAFWTYFFTVNAPFPTFYLIIRSLSPLRINFPPSHLSHTIFYSPQLSHAQFRHSALLINTDAAPASQHRRSGGAELKLKRCCVSLAFVTWPEIGRSVCLLWRERQQEASRALWLTTCFSSRVNPMQFRSLRHLWRDAARVQNTALSTDTAARHPPLPGRPDSSSVYFSHIIPAQVLRAQPSATIGKHCGSCFTLRPNYVKCNLASFYEASS